MATKLVYAVTDAVAGYNGGKVRLAAGQPWDAADPFVKAFPDLFTAVLDDSEVARTDEHPVETATAAPAEKRVTKRRAAAKPKE